MLQTTIDALLDLCNKAEELAAEIARRESDLSELKQLQKTVKRAIQSIEEMKPSDDQN